MSVVIKPAVFWVIIPAAGIGSRFEDSRKENRETIKVPKQYQLLTSTETIAEYTIKQVSRHSQVIGLILVLHPEDKHFAKLKSATSKPIYFVTGGATRTLSVLEALNFACQQKLVQKENWILIHDIARPLVSQEEISQLANAIHHHKEAYQGISLGLSINDSVKRIAHTFIAAETATIKTTAIKTILHSEIREQLWRSITPQAVHVGSLLAALTEYKHHAAVTDEMSALGLMGASCALIAGSSRNIKITTEEDWQLARQIIAMSAAH